MNISEIHNYIIARFDNDPMVNTITLTGDTSKENIYPLVYLNFKNVVKQDDKNRYIFDIAIYQQRDKVGKMKPSKLMEQDNYIDNLNDCQSIADKFIHYVQRLDIENDIYLEVSSLDKQTTVDGANLDGYTFTATFITTDTGYCNE